MIACGLLSSLAVISLWLSELAGWLALGGSSLAVGWGLARIRAERRAEPFDVVIPWDAARPVVVAGAAVEAFEVEWRGPLAVLCWKVPGQGREARLWWPDLLPPPARRELRLAASARAISSDTPQMAP